MVAASIWAREGVIGVVITICSVSHCAGKAVQVAEVHFR